MSFVSALNLLWALVAVLALLALGHQERRKPNSARRTRLERLLAVLLAAVSLFPAVSASDDIVRFQYLCSSCGNTSPHQSHEKNALHLARLLEALENFRVVSFYSLIFLLCFFTLVICIIRGTRERSLPSASCRAPPFTAFQPFPTY